MKKLCITFLLSGIISLSALIFSGCFSLPTGGGSAGSTEYLRIHVRAHSNDPSAQAVKYEVRDAIVEYLVPVAASADSEKNAEELLLPLLSKIEEIADGVLKAKGFDYGATAGLKTERFPLRAYGDLVLAEGEYRALVVELGSGEGDNWWCVVYPPLCFAGDESVRYQSRILETIEKWKKSR